MRIDVITLFPGMFTGPLTESILQRAQDANLLEIYFHDLKEFGLGEYRQVDDRPYGGGVGMVHRVDTVVPAIEAVLEQGDAKNVHSIYLSARGDTLTQPKVESLAHDYDRLLLLCGHYEGVDQRIMEGGWIDEEISIGPYVLTGGELPAMVLIDAVSRHIPGVLGKDESSHEESYSQATDGKREYPHYTRPEEFRGLSVPNVLLSGHHAEIEKWRKNQLS
ncbi:tRNA (guanosine(37)-N1)-methyltransferase TrmD [Candidatus Peregrinibacteria bacterium CG10_big_fil_rev_8_21_14_0_10_49_24]|nr:MAG: tRNA (guanosine(37)-N1)-methyltransferase TrmD [Candidatus Peregrinibacteria bacterium CG11_big_fil_rev_8_21_14_0_20_49_14]PIR51613.1 MAG: tRNA (guanosine(37)-N1)-methyltransferase TrmD [Candidatus Peregrinibacteria bacterium CG10_big_fil_rev_8_21_14_0_10_49_24]PJA68027.1 MAG: tRNA (guanosine(37)-N1)-methyltransferase TrmD [Candidatus Peregrinibacteria bacterium CG_4_9_14_3_um_filter_49_12]